MKTSHGDIFLRDRATEKTTDTRMIAANEMYVVTYGENLYGTNDAK